MLSEIDGIEFQTSTKRNESEKVYSSLYNDKILDASISKILSDYKGNFMKISEVSKIIRYSALKVISSTDNTFDANATFNESNIPAELSNLIRWILHGNTLLQGKRGEVLDNETRSVCNTLLRNIKTDRQMDYKSKDNDIAIFSGRYENNQTIALGLAVRKFGRRQGLIDAARFWIHDK